MHTALYSGRLGAFKALLAGPGGEVASGTKDSQGATPFHIACRGKGPAGGAAATALLDEASPAMVDVNVRDDEGRTPLYDATHHGHAGVVKVRGVETFRSIQAGPKTVPECLPPLAAAGADPPLRHNFTLVRNTLRTL